MNTYQRLSRGSDWHRADVKGNSVTIHAVDDSLDALKRFQPIAREAIDNKGDGYEIYDRSHKTSQQGDNHYDQIILVEKSD